MIENDGFLQDLINSILNKVSIIKKDIDSNGEIHYEYALEKLRGAKNDLDIFVKIFEKKKEEEELKASKEKKGEQ